MTTYPPKYLVTIGPEKTPWHNAYTLDEARDIAGFAASNHRTIAQVWINRRNGRQLYETIESARCLYCDALGAPSDSVPDEQDNEAWGSLAATHAPNCEWIATRAHRRMSPG